MRLKLPELLELRGLTEYQLAKSLKLSQPSVNAWIKGKAMAGGERRKVFPDPDSLEALCLFLECTPNDLLQLERESIGTTWRDVGTPRRGRPPKDAGFTYPVPEEGLRIGGPRDEEPPEYNVRPANDQA